MRNWLLYEQGLYNLAGRRRYLCLGYLQCNLFHVPITIIRTIDLPLKILNISGSVQKVSSSHQETFFPAESLSEKYSMNSLSFGHLTNIQIHHQGKKHSGTIF